MMKVKITAAVTMMEMTLTILNSTKVTETFITGYLLLSVPVESVLMARKR